MEILSGLDRSRIPACVRRSSPGASSTASTAATAGSSRSVLEWARSEGVSSALVTFDRHPEEVLRGRSVPLVTPLGERLRLIGALGVDFCVVLNFTIEFSKTSAEEFVRGIVAGRMTAKGIVLGHDSRFGRDRAGDLEFLTRLGKDVGLQVRRSDAEIFKGRPGLELAHPRCDLRGKPQGRHLPPGTAPVGDRDRREGRAARDEARVSHGQPGAPPRRQAAAGASTRPRCRSGTASTARW